MPAAAECVLARHEARDRGGRFIVDRLHPRLVHDREVIEVGRVLELDLPVALEPELVLTVRLDRVAGALFHEQVDPRLRAAEEILERFDRIVEAREDQPLVHADAQLHERQVAFLAHAFVAVAVRQRAQRAVERVRPAVIRAREALRVALVRFAHGRAAMAAAVLQHVDLAGLVAHDDHRLAADRRRDEVARVRQLAFVRDPDPGAVEDAVEPASNSAGS